MNKISNGETLPEIGKISPGIFEQVVYPRLGAKSNRILVGPQHGVDCGIVDLGHNQVMALTTDPLFIVPQYGWQRAAWFAFHILASDVTTSGLTPAYLTVDLNLPLSIKREELEMMWGVIHQESLKYGVSIITGHTAKYEGCHYPMVGGATMIALGSRDKYVTTQMAQPGDKIIITKGAAIEAAGLFAATFPALVAEKYGPEFAGKAQELFWKMSTVDDALAAASVGVRDQGVTSMHDATECGIWGGLYEIAHASRVGMRINKRDIIVDDVVDKICSLFNIDPYSSISEGTLLITCRDHAAGAILAALQGQGISASIVGEIISEEFGLKIIDKGIELNLEHPQVDPFWAAFGKAMQEQGD